MYKLLSSVKAEKQLKKLKIEYQEALISAFEEIEDDPFVGKPLNRDLTGRFSYKIGVFRIIYKVNFQDKTVRVLSAGHRSTVYN